MDETNTSTPKAPDRLQAALAAPCEVRLGTGTGRVIAHIPELGILVRADSVEAAHAEALRQRESRIREFAAEGLLDALPAPNLASSACAARPGLLGQLKVFLIKAAVVAALFLGAVNIISNGLRDVGYTLEKKLDGAANMSAEAVEKNRAKAAQVAEKLGPIVRELSALFARPEAPAVSPGVAPASPAASNSTARP
ncbi:MAG: hypothetical protein KKA55_06955 [Proteobacteria bacterium]|nr:hypothetical protein [Pseudomonadota bacterium]MBU1595257.1 hypothetical protein [Pseudomonadota bacterium]